MFRISEAKGEMVICCWMMVVRMLCVVTVYRQREVSYSKSSGSVARE